MIVIEKWQGLVTNASPYAVPGGGFVSQNNIQCLRPGQVEGRAGYSVKAATALHSMIQYRAGWVAGVDNSGNLHLIEIT